MLTSTSGKFWFVEVQMEECIFCKIASGEIQGLRIYENNETLASGMQELLEKEA